MKLGNEAGQCYYKILTTALHCLLPPECPVMVPLLCPSAPKHALSVHRRDKHTTPGETAWVCNLFVGPQFPYLKNGDNKGLVIKNWWNTAYEVPHKRCFQQVVPLMEWMMVWRRQFWTPKSSPHLWLYILKFEEKRKLRKNRSSDEQGDYTSLAIILAKV